MHVDFFDFIWSHSMIQEFRSKMFVAVLQTLWQGFRKVPSASHEQRRPPLAFFTKWTPALGGVVFCSEHRTSWKYGWRKGDAYEAPRGVGRARLKIQSYSVWQLCERADKREKNFHPPPYLPNLLPIRFLEGVAAEERRSWGKQSEFYSVWWDEFREHC